MKCEYSTRVTSQPYLKGVSRTHKDCLGKVADVLKTKQNKTKKTTTPNQKAASNSGDQHLVGFQHNWL